MPECVGAVLVVVVVLVTPVGRLCCPPTASGFKRPQPPPLPSVSPLRESLQFNLIGWSWASTPLPRCTPSCVGEWDNAAAWLVLVELDRLQPPLLELVEPPQPPLLELVEPPQPPLLELVQRPQPPLLDLLVELPQLPSRVDVERPPPPLLVEVRRPLCPPSTRCLLSGLLSLGWRPTVCLSLRPLLSLCMAFCLPGCLSSSPSVGLSVCLTVRLPSLPPFCSCWFKLASKLHSANNSASRSNTSASCSASSSCNTFASCSASRTFCSWRLRRSSSSCSNRWSTSSSCLLTPCLVLAG